MPSKIFTTTCGYVEQPPPHPKGDVPLADWELEKICYTKDHRNGEAMIAYLWSKEFQEYPIGSPELEKLHHHIAYHNPLLKLEPLKEETWASNRLAHKKGKCSVLMLGLGLPDNKALRLMYDVEQKTYDCRIVRVTSDEKKLDRKGPPSLKNQFSVEEVANEALDLLDEIEIPASSLLV